MRHFKPTGTPEEQLEKLKAAMDQWVDYNYDLHTKGAHSQPEDARRQELFDRLGHHIHANGIPLECEIWNVPKPESLRLMSQDFQSEEEIARYRPNIPVSIVQDVAVVIISDWIKNRLELLSVEEEDYRVGGRGYPVTTNVTWSLESRETWDHEPIRITYKF